MSRGLRTIPSPGVAITFDDGPHPEVTPVVLDILARAGAVATFFVVGNQAKAHPQLVQAICDRGHALGNHTQTHRNLLFTLPSQTSWEIEDCQRTLKDVTGSTPRLFRAPWGKLTLPARRTCRQLDLAAYHWTIAPEGWPQPWSPEDMVRVTLHKARPGAIIDLHDVPWHREAGFRTIAALPNILKGLARRGLTTVPLPATGP